MKHDENDIRMAMGFASVEEGDCAIKSAIDVFNSVSQTADSKSMTLERVIEHVRETALGKSTAEVSDYEARLAYTFMVMGEKRIASIIHGFLTQSFDSINSKEEYEEAAPALLYSVMRLIESL